MTTAMPRHPDTIADLAPDCRRVLREEYQRIQEAADAGPLDTVETYDAATGTVPVTIIVPRTYREAMVRGEYRGPSWSIRGKAAKVTASGRREAEVEPRKPTEDDFRAARRAIESGRVAIAVAEYKRVAAMWGVTC